MIKPTQPRILFANTDVGGGAYYRMATPATALQETGYAHTLSHGMAYDVDSIRALAPDVIVFQHHSTDEEIQILRSYRKTLPKSLLIYDIDDNFPAVPETSVHFDAVPKNIQLRIITAANLCDRVTVSTPELSTVMKSWLNKKDVRIVPNRLSKYTIDRMAEVANASKGINRTKPRIGWIGGAGHAGDINMLAEVILATQHLAQWVFMGMLPEGLDHRILEIHDAVPVGQYHEKLASLDLDIALAPLAPNAFNDSKSGIRVLEYGACGYPVIASDIAPYKEFKNITRLPFVAGVWETAIKEMLRDLPKFKAQGQALQEEIRTDHCEDDYINDIARDFLPKAKFHTPFKFESGETQTFEAVYGDKILKASQGESSHLLWLSPETDLQVSEAYVLVDGLANDIGSVSCFTNDGIYPTQNQFTLLQPYVVEAIRKSAKDCGNATSIEVPHPIGSAVLLNGNAVAEIGVPDIERFPDRAVALLDWGARANAAGYKAILNPTIFAYTPVAEEKLETQASIAIAGGWSPVFSRKIAEFKHQEVVAFAMQNIELDFNKREYKSPIANQSYKDWFAVYGSVNPKEVESMVGAMDDWSQTPKISVIMPTFNPDLIELKAAIQSVKNQYYENWELLIVDDASTNPAVWHTIQQAAQDDERIKVKRREENGHICASSNDAIALASGDWMVCLDHDDVLESYALYAIVESINQNPKLAFIYSDSDKISPEGELIEPYFAPDFNYDLLLAQNYVTHLSAYRLPQVREIDGYRAGFEGSQDWDLVLRYLTHTCGFPFDRNKIKHIPHVLYHWRQSENSVALNGNSKPYAYAAGRKAVLEHLVASKQQAAIVPNPLSPGFNMVRYLLSDVQPKASIIIQTRDNSKQLGDCINSIVSVTAYDNYEIIVLDNGWRKDALKEVKDKNRVTLVPNQGPFNYAASNNKGAELATGEVLVFLNDDTQAVEAVWLNDMVALALRPWTGAVGPRLIYGNGKVQQNGTIIDMTAGPGQKALHAFQGDDLRNPGTVGRGVIAAEWSCVTGACLAIRKSVYLGVGQMDAENFPRDYNDVDLCLRLKSHGYYNIVASHILMIHHEGQSKAKFAKEHDAEALIKDEAKLVATHGKYVDPYLNPNLAFNPGLNGIRTPGVPLPWKSEESLERVLVINGSHEVAVNYYQFGYLAYCVNLDGHKLVSSYPRMSHVQTMDTRDPPVELLYLCQKQEITKVILNGVGEGTYGVFGYLAQMEDYGIHVEYIVNPTEKEETLPEPIKAYLWSQAKKMDLDVAA